jgi:PadR family transcriptional regulator AphA
MSLRFALLALLTAQPMSGYDLAKAFHSSVGHVWHAPDSQIYPELRRMETEGLVVGAPVARKRVYSIAPEGVAAFEEWMSAPIEYTRERDTAHLRAAYFEWTEPDRAKAHLAAHMAHFEELRDQWTSQLTSIRDHTHPSIAKRLAMNPESEWPRIVAYKAYAYEGLIAQAEQEIDWAGRGLRLVDELSDQSLAR